MCVCQRLSGREICFREREPAVKLISKSIKWKVFVKVFSPPGKQQEMEMSMEVKFGSSVKNVGQMYVSKDRTRKKKKQKQEKQWKILGNWKSGIYWKIKKNTHTDRNRSQKSRVKKKNFSVIKIKKYFSTTWRRELVSYGFKKMAKIGKLRDREIEIAHGRRVEFRKFEGKEKYVVLIMADRFFYVPCVIHA